MTKDQARQTLLNACVDDFGWSLRNSQDFSEQMAREGFKGFAQMTDLELVAATVDAGLSDRPGSPDIDKAIIMVRGF